MKRNLDQREMARRILGTMLGSGLSTDEINAFADRLITDTSFALNLGFSLKRHLELLDFDVPLTAPLPTASDSYWVSEASRVIDKQRISKKKLIELALMSRILSASPTSLQRLSVREILTRIFENADDSQANEFLKRLGHNVESDPYLKGIQQG